MLDQTATTGNPAPRRAHPEPPPTRSWREQVTAWFRGYTPRHARPREHRLPRWAEFAIIFTVGLVVAFGTHLFLARPYMVPSTSMTPTLQPGDRIVACLPCTVNRGDMVVFTDPGGWMNPDTDGYLVKRVIGMPGDTVELTGGQLVVNGEPLHEPYLASGHVGDGQWSVTVPSGRLWVMGDNRNGSADSRAHDDGTGQAGSISTDRVVGVVFAVAFPLDHARIINQP